MDGASAARDPTLLVVAPATESPTETLRRFVYAVERLNERRLVRTGQLRSSLSVNAPGIGAPVQLEMHDPDEEDLRSFLLDFRKLVAPKEPVYVGRVLNAAYRHVSSDDLAARVTEARAGWKRELRGSMGFVVNDQEIRAETIVDLWINGYYFHDDPDKARRLEALAQVPLARFHFINAVVGTANLINWLAGFCRIVLREGLLLDRPVR